MKLGFPKPLIVGVIAAGLACLFLAGVVAGEHSWSGSYISAGFVAAGGLLALWIGLSELSWPEGPKIATEDLRLEAIRRFEAAETLGEYKEVRGWAKGFSWDECSADGLKAVWAADAAAKARATEAHARVAAIILDPMGPLK